MTIFCGHWPNVNIVYKRGLARALTQFSQTMSRFVKGSEGLCSALVLAAYDPWGDPVIPQLISKDEFDHNSVDDFIKSEPFELLLIRIECLVNAHFEEAAIRLCHGCLKNYSSSPATIENECGNDHWKWTFMEWLLRLLFRKGRLNELVAVSSSYSCHDGVRLIYRTRTSQMSDSEHLTETLINLFLVRDLLFQSDYCCTSELMKLWCEFQVQKQKSFSEIQEGARKLLVGHASSSAHFYLFVDILWGKFGPSLLPLYLEMYIRGLTSDLNFLEAARQADNKEYVIEIENHMAAMYFKLSSIFNSINKEISLECMLSAFSLDPTKERLDWIKKLSLQISKEKALKVSSCKDEMCKHKSCIKGIGCHNTHPSSTKRKAVVMCDQAIQVGDDSFENENFSDILIEHRTLQDEIKTAMNCLENGKEFDQVINQEVDDVKSNFKKSNDMDEEFLKDSEGSKNKSITLKISDTQLDINDENKDLNSHQDQIQKDNEILENHVNHINNCDSEVLDLTAGRKIEEENFNKTTLSQNGDLPKEIENEYVVSKLCCKTLCNHVKTTHNNEDVKGTCNNVECKNEDFELVKSAEEDHVVSEKSIESKNIENSIPENLKVNKQECVNGELANCLDAKNTMKDTQHGSDVCVNGYDKVEMKEHENNFEKHTENGSEHNHERICNNKTVINAPAEESVDIDKEALSTMTDITKSCTLENKTESVCENSENPDKKILDHSEIVNSSNDNEGTNLTIQQNSDKKILDHSEIVNSCNDNEGTNLTIQQNPDKKILDHSEIVNCSNDNEAANSHIQQNPTNSHSVSHIVLDSNIPGVSSDLLSDFVTVLESLRNKQLKSSTKWSQIKHMCEDYLGNVTNIRCAMLNMQLNASVDSEADSTSEFANGGKGFESHQSNDSVVEDHYAEKMHVFKRFMNGDEVAGMATYVNLSDIHCPQIPLEKLFYTDHSSSHLGHKKRHKKHRNHDKNPEKVVLRKLRHGSRAERELAKRKKRKKRKGKRTKTHAKKHHFTHGKVRKDYLKNRKKKHRLKKKKENSGFISGDYCSDFSSAELMRLVKEHSNNYSKNPGVASKHPHTSGLPISPSVASSDATDEPSRKKRKVSFDKKGKAGKCHDKHKHEKSKSSKRKKKMAVAKCASELKNIPAENRVGNNLETSVNDYSRILQFASVKKMEAVQIHQRSVALNLSSKVNREEAAQPYLHEENQPLMGQCESNSQLQQLMQQNFENCTPEDILKMPMLMSRQHPEMASACNSSGYDADLVSAANNQAVLKYVCSKMTSHLLSVAQSNCMMRSASSPVTVTTASSSRIAPKKNPSAIQPQNLSNIKHVIIERKNVPYKISNASSTLSGALIPVNSLASSSKSDSHKLVGSVLTGGITYPVVSSSPQVTALTIPVARSPAAQVISNKFVIPISQCGSIRTPSTSTLTLAKADSRTFATAAGRKSATGVIIVQNGNNTQIISSTQQPRNIMACISSSKVSLPTLKGRANTVVTKTVPKMIKQAAKKLSQPPLKKPAIKAAAVGKIGASSSISENVKKAIFDVTLNKDVIKDQVEPQNLSTRSPVQDIIPVPRPLDEPKPSPEIPEEVINKSSTSEPTDFKALKVDPETNQLPSSTVDNASTIEKSVSPVVHSSPTENAPSSPKGDDTILVSDSSISTPVETDLKQLFKNSSQNDKIDEDEKESNDSKADEKVSINKSVEENVEKMETEKDKVEETEKDKASNMEKISEPEPSTSSPIAEKIEKISLLKKETESPKSEKNGTAVSSNANIVQNTNTDKLSKILVSAACISEEKPKSCSIAKSLNLSTGDQQKELQPITSGTMSNVKAPVKTSTQNKNEGGTQVSDVPTRSFTSISDAVRFSLMDMDDATDSVENQVLQAFQVSHESSQDSPRYENSNNEGDTNTSSSPAVILTSPQSTTATELNVSRVSQRFETSVQHSQTEKFSECQSTVSRTATWILEDSPINESSQAISVQKSPDIDFSESKEDEKPKKKKKRKDRVDRDSESSPKFWCEICSKGFCSAYNLRRHCRNVHKMDLPRGSSDLPFSNSKCLPHIQQAESSPNESTSARNPYVQQSSVSPKGSDFMLQSPSREAKSQDYTVKASPSPHATQIQNSEFQMQTPTRISSQASSAHASSPKDFRLATPTSAASVQVSQNKLSSVNKSPTSPKFQRLPTACPTSQVPQLAKMSQMQQVALCNQSTLQQQRQLGQLQASGLLQPLPSVACQAQQVQANQCPHFQNKQLAQRIDQLQLMHHATQHPSVQHVPHGIQKQAQTQQFKKCNTSQQCTKMTDSEQIQQAAQLAQNQHILANQQMQKLIQIRQNALAASGVASQIALGTAVPMQGSAVKAATQCFQTQLAAARQAAVAAQLPSSQRSQGVSYLPSHDGSGHQFFSPAMQSNQEQTSCPHPSFTAQNVSEFSSNTPTYPTIRLSTETNDGLEDLEQFLLENMPWSGDQAASHGLAQQGGNRPSSADSLTLTIPSQASGTSQHRSGIGGKNKPSISRPKPRKPVATPGSKNLLGNLGRGVKKKSCPKKLTKSLDTDCTISKSEGFCQTNIIMPASHGLHIMPKHNERAIEMEMHKSKLVKDNAINTVNETDSSDSIQCINVTRNTIPKSATMGINFSTFAPTGICASDKATSSICNVDPTSSKEMFDISSKNSFLDQCNLVSKSCSNLDQSKTAANINYGIGHSSGITFDSTGKEASSNFKNYPLSATSPMYSKKAKTSSSQDIFLGQRNSEDCDVHSDTHRKTSVQDCKIQETVQSFEGKKQYDLANSLPVQEGVKPETFKHSDLFLGGSELIDKGKDSNNNTKFNEILELKENKMSDTKVPLNAVKNKASLIKENGKKYIENKVDISKFAANEITKNELNSLAPSCTEEPKLDFPKRSISSNEIIKTELNAFTPSCTDHKSDSSKRSISSPQPKTICIGENENMPKDICTDDSENMSNICTGDSESIYSVNNEKLPENTSDVINSHTKNAIPINTLKSEKNFEEKVLKKINTHDVKSPDSAGKLNKNMSEENIFVPKPNKNVQNSSHENIIPNDENHLPNQTDNENSNFEQGAKRIALRTRKNGDAANKINDSDKSMIFFTSEKAKDDLKISITKEKLPEEKSKQENYKNEIVKNDSKKTCQKLVSEPETQEKGVLNSDKTFTEETEINGNLCTMSPCCDEIENNTSLDNKTLDDEFCISKVIHDDCMEEIPTGRLRLRDTPKTSVKRTCPCCIDSKEPKKCRENSAGNIPKMNNSIKGKSTLKARNTANGLSAKVNTRSSQRLRSRNNT